MPTNEGSVSNIKAALREEFRDARRIFVQKTEPKKLNLVLDKISENLLAVTHEIDGIIASYQAVASEVPVKTFEAAKQTQNSKVVFCYPKVVSEALQFYKVSSSKDLSPGAFNILEPAPIEKRLVKSDDILCVLVPGVAFDAKGFRLGSGFGFYDRFLANFKGLKIGVGYTCQMSKSNFSVESHDIKMDWVVCEDFAMQVKEDKKWN